MYAEKRDFRVGLDLDGVIAKHALGGFWVRVRKIKEKFLKKLHTRAYYYPKSSFEKNTWKIINWLRLPDKEAMQLIKKLKDNGLKFYLITGRFNFNYPLTIKWLKKYKLFELFEKVHVNVEDIDPTKFKAGKIKSEKINFFVDDDLEVLSNLNGNGNSARLFWVVPKHRNGNENSLNGITTCYDLSDALRKMEGKIK